MAIFAEMTAITEGLSDKQKLAIAAAVGAGVCIGATGIIVYQRLSAVSIFLD